MAALLFLPAIYQLLQILWQPQANGLLEGDSKGYAVLLAAIVGAPLVVWRTVVAHMQSNTAAQGLITDRINKAVEQLGAEKTVWEGGGQSSKPNLEVRLGGIYALERIAQDSERDHIMVMEILCAYVRENSLTQNIAEYPYGATKFTEEWKDWYVKLPSLRIDIQAVIDVIARRNSRQIGKEIVENYRLDLRYCNLRRADFRQGNFDRALMDACFMDTAQMNGVKLNGTQLHLAQLNGTDLDSAELNNAILINAKLYDSRLSKVKLKNSNLSSALLSESWLFKAEIDGANLNGANLNNTELAFATMTLASIRNTDISAAKNLSVDQVTSMYGDKTTTLTKDFTELPKHWPTDEMDELEFDRSWEAHKNANR